MIINGKEYFKVRDPQANESGWAFKDDNGKIILDNDFERIPIGSSLTLDEDRYTILDYDIDVK